MSKPSSPTIEELAVGDRIWISRSAGSHEVRDRGTISAICDSTVELDGNCERAFNLDFAADFGYLDRAAVEIRDILAPAGDIRMDAYYYSFEKTGIGVVDEILSAVATAGKHLHSTEDWAEEDLPLDGLTEEQRIQQAANRAAEAIRKALAQ